MYGIKILITPVIGAVIGWVTNYLAIKLIFRPHRRVIIPILNYPIQGVIPKRKAELARTIGITVENNLLSYSDLVDELLNDELKDEIIDAIKTKTGESVDRRLPRLVPSPIKRLIKGYLDNIIEQEGRLMIEDYAQEFFNNTRGRISISKIVEDKINGFDFSQLEGIVLDTARSELKHIEYIGAVLGFVIGCVQVVAMHLL